MEKYFQQWILQGGDLFEKNNNSCIGAYDNGYSPYIVRMHRDG
jgi:hypothetical protein